MKEIYAVAPLLLDYWNHLRAIRGDYFSGLGRFLPDSYYSFYGSPSFCKLPLEVGGLEEKLE